MIRTCTLLIVSFLVFAGSATAAVDVRNVTFKTKTAGKIVFSHKMHMNQKGMTNNCKACHDAIFSIKKKTRSTMADMEKGKSCGACHNGKNAFPLNECVRCHQTKEIVYQVKATGSTHFSHKNHIALSPNCSTCHPALFAAGHNKRASMADMEKGKSCGACHDGKKAFTVKNCSTCHPVKEITFKVKETGPTLFSHAKHIEAYQCRDCHTRLYPTARRTKPVSMAEMEKGQSCGACHNGKDASPLKSCSTCHPTKELSFEVKDAGNVAFSHTVHSGLFKCGDCHVSIYATARSKTKVSMKEMESGTSCGACHDGKSAFSVKEKCETCHKM